MDWTKLKSQEVCSECGIKGSFEPLLGLRTSHQLGQTFADMKTRWFCDPCFLALLEKKK